MADVNLTYNPAVNTLVFGQTVKKTVALTVTFAVPFSAPPVVLVSQQWRISPGGPEIVQSVTAKDFTMSSGNAASDYYVNWIAIGPV